MASIGSYLNNLEARMTEVKLIMADVVSIPNMKKNDRAALVNGWMKILNITSQVKAELASPRRLKMIGIGVRHE